MKSFFIVHRLHQPEHFYNKTGDFLYRSSLNTLKFENIHCKWRGSVVFSIYKKLKKHRDL